MTNPKAVRGLTTQTLTAPVANFQEITDIQSHSGRYPGGNIQSCFMHSQEGKREEKKWQFSNAW
jgi:hypothetical protein